MSYNSITNKTVHILAEGLALSNSIRSLIMDGNMLTRSGAVDIHDALQRENGDTIHLSIQDCGVNGKLSHEFDPSEPGGEYNLNMASEYDMKILFNLVKIAMEGRGDFQRGSMQVDGKSAFFSAPELQKHFEAWISQNSDAGGGSSARTLLPEKGCLSFRLLLSLPLCVRDLERSVWRLMAYRQQLYRLCRRRVTG